MSTRIVIWTGLILAAASACWATPPAITADFCEVTSHSTIRCHWITDIPASTRIKFGTSSGDYGPCPNGPRCWDRPFGNLRTHSFSISGLNPSTLYYLVICSTNGGDETCSAEKTFTTQPLPDPYPGLPLAPDPADALEPSTGTVRTVGPDCLAPITGLQAQINAAQLGDTIVIPTTTLNCSGQFVFPNKTSGSGTITIATDAGNRPPAGVRDHPTRNGHSIIAMTVINAQYSSLITSNWNDFNDGNPCRMSNAVKPGTYVYRQFVAAWSLRRCSFKPGQVAVVSATNASPIEVTTASEHGLAENETICVTGVAGNTNANGCWVAKNVTALTARLFRSDGSPRGGNGAYAGGGIVRGMEWKAVPTSYSGNGRPTGTCVPNTWGHDTGTIYFEHGVYRCGKDARWYRVQFWSSDALIAPSGEGSRRNVTFLFNTGAHHYRITGLKFVPPPFDLEEELSVGPRRRSGVELTAGSMIGGIAEFARNTHHIEFDQVSMDMDPAGWAMHTVFGGLSTLPKPKHFRLTNSYIAGANAWTQARHVSFENEDQSTGIDLTGGNGPFLIHNNYLEIYGFCLYYQEHGGLGGLAGNLTFTRNTCTKKLRYMDGHPDYAAAGLTGKWWGRQLFECKDCQKVLIQGNVFENNWVDQTRASGAIAVGAQFGFNFGSWSNGVFTTFGNWPAFAELNPGDWVMDMDNRRLMQVTAVEPPNALIVDGGPASGVASLCKANGNNGGVRDIDIRENVFRGQAIALVSFGSPYASYAPRCYPAPHQRIRFSNNVVFLDGSQHSASGNSSPSATSPWLLSEGQEITYTHNSTYVVFDDPVSGYNAIQFSEDSAEKQAWKFDGFVMRDNIFGFGSVSAIWRHGGTSGTNALNAQYGSSYTAAPNVYMRPGGNPGGYPSGSFFETSWNNVGYAAPQNGDLRLRANSANLSSGRRASDRTDMGADVDAVDRVRGAVLNVRHRNVTANSAVVSFFAADGVGCPVDYGTDPTFTGATRIENPVTPAIQDVSLSGLMPDTVYHYRVACSVEQPVGQFRTAAF